MSSLIIRATCMSHAELGSESGACAGLRRTLGRVCFNMLAAKCPISTSMSVFSPDVPALRLVAGLDRVKFQ